MSESALIYTLNEQGIATLTLNRPEVHNAFDDTLIAALIEQLESAAADQFLRVLVLNANGKCFSAGADLNWMRRTAAYSAAQNQADAKQLARLMAVLNEFPRPTIAMVQGLAFGGGVGLIACCDIAVAVRSALFSLSEVRLGLIPAVISPYVIEAIGARNARRYFLTAERFNTQQACQLGLIHQCVDDVVELQSTLDGIIAEILQGGPHAQQAAKQLIARVNGQNNDAALQNETAAFIAEIRQGEEAQHGLTAFLNKQKPEWSEG